MALGEPPSANGNAALRGRTDHGELFTPQSPCPLRDAGRCPPQPTDATVSAAYAAI